MPEQFKGVKSQYEGEEIKTSYDKKIAKLARKITDNIPVKIRGVKSTDPEYWGLKEMIDEDICNVALKMKVRAHYTFEELIKMNKEYNPIELQKILDRAADVGLFEYDYGDMYTHEGPIAGAKKIRRYRLPFFVPGSAELFNSRMETIDKKPQIASFFERMTFLPLENVTSMIPPGGDGVGMHVIPVEKAIDMKNESLDIEHISFWLKKYEGHISAGLCSCRYSRAAIGEGCTDDARDWCIQTGDMADYAVETNKAHYITKEEALEILDKAEKNGYVHQITNIDGENKIFDICNCNVKICNALRTAMLFNTPNLSRSAYTATVDPQKCVACGLCVEICPAGAVKLGQKLCHKDGRPFEYEKAILPDKIRWGKYAWDENYRDTMRQSETYKTGTAPCKVACPAHVPVQGYLKKANQGDYLGALKLIKKENPFPAVCGRVCNKRCEEACTRGKIDKAVAIDAVKKFVADFDLKKDTRYIPEKIIEKVYGDFDDKIAIIGAGPAGLSCAYYLALAGYHPTVFEKNPLPGGMLLYGIPSYKLEKDVIEAEIDIIKELGVEIKCNCNVGSDITIDELKKEGYKAFYIAIGCQGGKRPQIENDDAEGTFIAVDYLRDSYENRKEFKGDVVVVGGGNVAVDCARTAKRLKAKSVKMICLEKRDEMPASNEEVFETLDENIEIINSYGPKEINLKDNKVSKIIFKKCIQTINKETNKFEPLYDESDTIEVATDRVIFAIGQTIEWGKLLEGTSVKFWHGNYPVADKMTYQTDDPDIFVGGDCYTGPKFVIDAIACGHQVSESIRRHVRGANKTIGFAQRNFTPLDKEDIMIPSYDDCGRQEEKMDLTKDYKNSFEDCHLTFTEEEVKKETARCLSCGASVVDPNKCIGCGLCTTKCEFDAIHLVRDHPKNSHLIPAEKKVSGLAKYALGRGAKIIFNSASKEARIMRQKRKEFKKMNKENKKINPHTGASK
jgi:NADPH-dependent glutamate synthase beta subunit-like oxidoreductase